MFLAWNGEETTVGTFSRVFLGASPPNTLGVVSFSSSLSSVAFFKNVPIGSESHPHL